MRTFFKCVDVCVGLLVTASTVIADMPGQSPRHNYPKLTVKVVDSQGKPVEGVVVHLFLSQFPLCACNTVSGCHIEGFPAATDAKGKAVFERLGSGNTYAACINSECSSTPSGACQDATDCIFSGSCLQFTTSSKGGGNINLQFTLP